MADYGDYGLGIAEAFQKYLKTGEEKHIDKYSARELDTAISRLSPHYNQNKRWFRLLEQRAIELNDEIDVDRVSFIDLIRYKWLTKILLFASGVVLGLLL